MSRTSKCLAAGAACFVILLGLIAPTLAKAGGRGKQVNGLPLVSNVPPVVPKLKPGFIGNAAFHDDRLGLSGEVVQGDGILITQVDPFKPAARAGLEQGDAILWINQVPMLSQDDFYRALRHEPQARLIVRDVRTGRRVYYQAHLPVGWSQQPLPDQIDLSGRWQSNLGDVQLRQYGSTVVGTIRSNSGRLVQIRGRFDGDKFEFTWSSDARRYGDGQLAVTLDGSTMLGTLTSNQGYSYSWTLTR